MTNEELYAFRKMALTDATEHVGGLIEAHPLPEGKVTESKGFFNTETLATALQSRIDSDLVIANWLLEGMDLEVERYALLSNNTTEETFVMPDRFTEAPWTPEDDDDDV